MYLLPFGIFTDIFAACGVVLGGIIVLVLALLVIAFYIAVGLLSFVLIWGTISAAWYWIQRLYCSIAGKEPPAEAEIIGHKYLKSMEDAMWRYDHHLKDKLEKMRNENR